MDEISIVVYGQGIKGKKVARRNGRRITLTLAKKLIADKMPSQIIPTPNYDKLVYII